MINLFENTLHPERYHGRGKRPPFFEGWYFKLIDASTQNRLAVIPGVFLSGNPHAFVQVLDGETGQAWYHEYPLDQFWAARDRFEVHIGANRFTPDFVSLNIKRPNQTLFGELRLGGLTPWPTTVTSPGIMGWYAWVPTMECYHGVVSLDHQIYGTLEIDGTAVDFTGGRGYTEKDWGQSFPSAWIWMQTNHFETVGTSLSASIALIPWRSSQFPGFIVGFWHDGTLYRFATYTGAKVEELIVTDELVKWTMADKQHRLRIEAQRGEQRQFGLLKGPTTVEMGKRVAESLTATVRVQLSELKGGREATLFVGNGRFAGLEVHNVEAELLEMARKGR